MGTRIWSNADDLDQVQAAESRRAPWHAHK
jgi:hypothetical protein